MKAMKLYSFLLAGIFALTAVACKDGNNNRNNNDNTTTAEGIEKIAGDGQKSWRMKKEVSATGDVDRASRDEKDDEINFHTNNTFSLIDERGTSTGKWTYDGNTLTLQFEGDNVSETFTVEDLTDNRMRLVAVDGSEMVLVETE
jgi:hypothetical protein